ncbi:hypothetical protein RIR_e30777_A0A2I1FPF8_9GLOM [Rhizophagus irregularis DAOM 181602=DAOM 197198]|nr:hypothetical protein RIR_e30777_A0A2I1FPF8_9GLOM [Rhizophagus irregularis DAOM 181602=DAOM 197198]
MCSQLRQINRPPYGAQYRAPYERPPFTTPGGPLTYGQTSRVAILLVLPHNVQPIWLLDQVMVYLWVAYH